MILGLTLTMINNQFRHRRLTMGLTSLSHSWPQTSKKTHCCSASKIIEPMTYSNRMTIRPWDVVSAIYYFGRTSDRYSGCVLFVPIITSASSASQTTNRTTFWLKLGQMLNFSYSSLSHPSTVVNLKTDSTSKGSRNHGSFKTQARRSGLWALSASKSTFGSLKPWATNFRQRFRIYSKL